MLHWTWRRTFLGNNTGFYTKNAQDHDLSESIDSQDPVPVGGHIGPLQNGTHTHGVSIVIYDINTLISIVVPLFVCFRGRGT